MKVVCFTESVSRLGGGLFEAERRIQQAAHAHDSSLDTTVFGMHDQESDSDRQLWTPIQAETVAVQGIPKSLGFSRDYRRRLSKIQPDLVYSIGLWKYFSRACLKWHEETGKPYIVAPHGMADEWAMQNHRLRKKLLWSLYQGRHLQQSNCIRALNEAEASSIRNLGLANPIALIPNGVDLPDLEKAQTPPPANAKMRLLFLGRIHHKKGLATLLQAWKSNLATLTDWQLQIAGWGADEDVAQLKNQIDELGLADSVQFLGPVFDDDKERVFRGASAFILPSYSEGMPMTILEAWSYCLPVIMTPACNIPEGDQFNACLMCRPNADEVGEAICRLASMSSSERAEMGVNGRNLVEQQFTWETVAKRLVDVYHWVLGERENPECVRFD